MFEPFPLGLSGGRRSDRHGVIERRTTLALSRSFLIVAIDGSKFKAVNNRDKNFTVAKVAKRIEQVEASIARYLAVLDRADREDGDLAEAKTIRLKEKIEGL